MNKAILTVKKQQAEEKKEVVKSLLVLVKEGKRVDLKKEKVPL
jgi:hypothetical protein